MRILIVRTDRIGDVVLSVPVIENIREAYPHAHIAFMCSPLTQDIVRTNPFLDEVIVYDKTGAHQGILSTVRFAFQLKSRRFDWAIILHSTNRVNWIAFLAGIPMRIGWDRKAGFLLTQRIPYTKRLGQKHERDYNLELLTHLNVPIVSRRIRLYPDREAQRRMEQLLRAQGITDEDTLVGMHPLSSCPSKTWPLHHYEIVAARLLEEYKIKVVVVGGSKIPFSAIARVSPGIINFSGRLSTGELVALTTRFRIIVSNDSGPVHIAGGVGVPCVVLFGRKQPGLSPRRWGPLGEQDIVIHKDVGCTECQAHECTKEFLCIRSIGVEEVLECVRPFLAKP